MDEIPKEMRSPRKAEPYNGTDEAWWYINKRSIDVYATSSAQAELCTTVVRLTRHQLERALEIMDSV
jgi:hypothetical protein